MTRILFVKTSSLGDVVQNCPAVSDAARMLPGAQIDWVVEEPFAGIAAMHASVRRVIPVALRRWRRALWSPAVWGELRAFRRALTAERYDAVIDSQALLKSAAMCFWAAGTKHGMDGPSAREPLAARFYDVLHTVPRRMALEELARLFVHARGVIGLDTGLTHLAAALGAPTVGIYCGSDPALNGLYGAPQAKNVGGPGRAPEASEVLKQCA